jgi:hypothetical protein
LPLSDSSRTHSTSVSLVVLGMPRPRAAGRFVTVVDALTVGKGWRLPYCTASSVTLASSLNVTTCGRDIHQYAPAARPMMRIEATLHSRIFIFITFSVYCSQASDLFFRGLPSIPPAGETGKLKSINSLPPEKLRRIINPARFSANYNFPYGL